MADHRILPIEAVDPLTRLSMACPALPLCGLAVTEAERLMPTMIKRVRAVMDHLGLLDEEVMMRMTGCPNGCGRPYMAELGFVGDGKASYQLYVGGSPVLTRVGFEYKERCKTKTIEHSLEPSSPCGATSALTRARPSATSPRAWASPRSRPSRRITSARRPWRSSGLARGGPVYTFIF